MNRGQELLQAGTKEREARERLRELAAPWYAFRFPNSSLASAATGAVIAILFIIQPPSSAISPGEFAALVFVIWTATALWYFTRRDRRWRELIREESPELARKLEEER